MLVAARTVLTAAHLVRDAEPADVQFVPATGTPIVADAIRVDRTLDVALLTLASDCESTTWVADAENGDRWAIALPPTLDPSIGGVVTESRRSTRTRSVWSVRPCSSR